MSHAENASRRQFLKGAAAVAVGTTLASGLGVARSAHAAGSDVLKIALVGCGGRGTGAATDCLGTGSQNIKLVALADLFQDRIDGAVKQLKHQVPAKLDLPSDRLFVGFDAYKKVLQSDADIIVLGTPPGFRPMHHAAAIAAGKHVFMEKPCCVDAPGFRLLMKTNELADQKGLKVAVGMQRRHSNEYIGPIQKIHDGEIGDVLLLRAYWNGGFFSGGFEQRQPNQTEMEFQIRNWNFFRWLSGDHLVEQHVHNLDVCNWVKNDHPSEANGMGSRQRRKNAQIFDHHFIEFTYKDGAKLYSQCRQMSGCPDHVAEYVVGTKGKVDFVHKNGSDGYSNEHKDLVNAIRNGTKLNDGWHGATSSMTAVLGRMATYSGQVVKWDDAVAKGPSEMPQTYAMNANPPFLPDAEGNYEVPTPGVYKPF